MTSEITGTSRKPKAVLSVKGAGFLQESYETGSEAIRARASELRKLGYRVIVSSMGLQLTRYGLIKLTMITVQFEGEGPDAAPYERRFD